MCTSHIKRTFLLLLFFIWILLVVFAARVLAQDTVGVGLAKLPWLHCFTIKCYTLFKAENWSLSGISPNLSISISSCGSKHTQYTNSIKLQDLRSWPLQTNAKTWPWLSQVLGLPNLVSWTLFTSLMGNSVLIDSWFHMILSWRHYCFLPVLFVIARLVSLKLNQPSQNDTTSRVDIKNDLRINSYNYSIIQKSKAINMNLPFVSVSYVGLQRILTVGPWPVRLQHQTWMADLADKL